MINKYYLFSLLCLLFLYRASKGLEHSSHEGVLVKSNSSPFPTLHYVAVDQFDYFARYKSFSKEKNNYEVNIEDRKIEHFRQLINIDHSRSLIINPLDIPEILSLASYLQPINKKAIYISVGIIKSLQKNNEYQLKKSMQNELIQLIREGFGGIKNHTQVEKNVWMSGVIDPIQAFEMASYFCSNFNMDEADNNIQILLSLLNVALNHEKYGPSNKVLELFEVQNPIIQHQEVLGNFLYAKMYSESLFEPIVEHFFQRSTFHWWDKANEGWLESDVPYNLIQKWYTTSEYVKLYNLLYKDSLIITQFDQEGRINQNKKHCYTHLPLNYCFSKEQYCFFGFKNYSDNPNESQIKQLFKVDIDILRKFGKKFEQEDKFIQTLSFDELFIDKSINDISTLKKVDIHIEKEQKDERCKLFKQTIETDFMLHKKQNGKYRNEHYTTYSYIPKLDSTQKACESTFNRYYRKNIEFFCKGVLLPGYLLGISTPLLNKYFLAFSGFMALVGNIISFTKLYWNYKRDIALSIARNGIKIRYKVSE